MQQRQQQQHAEQFWQQHGHRHQQQQQQHPSWQPPEHAVPHWDSRHAAAPGVMPPGQGLGDGPGVVGRTSSNGSRMTQHSHHSSQYPCAAAGGGSAYMLPQQEGAAAPWEEPGWEHNQQQQQLPQQGGGALRRHHASEHSWQQHAEQQQQQLGQAGPYRSGSGLDTGPNPEGSPAEGLEGGRRLQQRPEGFGLVGRQVRVWWPLDREWYSGTIQVGLLLQTLIHILPTSNPQLCMML
jgi:hypothetical protein